MSARSMPTRTLLPSLERARGRRWRLTRARAASGEMPSRSAISTYVSRSIMGDVRLVTVRTRLPADGCRSVNDRLVTAWAKPGYRRRLCCSQQFPHLLQLSDQLVLHLLGL